MLHESLAKLTVFSNTFYDSIWHLDYGLSPRKLESVRRRQKLFLASKGRQSLLQWDDVEVTEIARWANELIAMLDPKKGLDADDLFDD